MIYCAGRWSWPPDVTRRQRMGDLRALGRYLPLPSAR